MIEKNVHTFTAELQILLSLCLTLILLSVFISHVHRGNAEYLMEQVDNGFYYSIPHKLRAYSTSSISFLYIFSLGNFIMINSYFYKTTVFCINNIRCV